MRINLTKKNTQITETMYSFIRERLEKLQKFTLQIDEADVVIKLEKYRWFTEINIPVKGSLIHAEAETEDFRSSFEKALEKVERQIKKRRGKITHHKGGAKETFEEEL